MQLCREAITYYRLDESDRIIEAIPLRGSWFAKSVSTLTDKGLAFAQVVECRIPVENAPDGFTPRAGDMLLRGAPPADAQTAAALKRAHGAATVKAVRDNRRTVLAPHWKLEAM
nr:MAG TPA: hypothetical protein [Caudoviricetes sp.]